jgi:chromosome segregation ATPase
MTNTRISKATQSADVRIAQLQQALDACTVERNSAWARLLEIQVDREAQDAAWTARLTEAESRTEQERKLQAEQTSGWQRAITDFEAELRTARSELAKRDLRIETLLQTLNEAENALATSNATIGRLDAQVAANHAELAGMQGALRDAEQQIAALYRSSSWRLTEPLRALKRHWPRLRSLVGAWLQAIYIALPLPWPLKLRIKGILFALFIPLLRDTSAYHDWLEFERARWRK